MIFFNLIIFQKKDPLFDNTYDGLPMDTAPPGILVKRVLL